MLATLLAASVALTPALENWTAGARLKRVDLLQLLDELAAPPLPEQSPAP